MEVEQVSELLYIAPVANLPSILQDGIVSHRLARQIEHVSVAGDVFQQRRAKKTVPGGLRLHEYVPLYICVRNPMMFRRRAQHAELCVVRVDAAVLHEPGVVVADGNASSDYTAFWPSPDGLSKVDYETVHAEWWTDEPNEIDRWVKTRVKCAEILVPHRVPVEHILGVYSSREATNEELLGLANDLECTVRSHLFFGG